MTEASRPRVGFHDFLNSKPILHPFRHGLVEMPFKLIIDTPANLAERFHAGELDMALVPSIEYARNKDAVIVPVVCIASLGRVQTVLLFSEKAVEEVDSVCVDPRSRTSVAMLRILFREKFGKDPSIVVGGGDPAKMLDSAEAGLVIGDAAFSIDREKYVVHDLGEMWFSHCGRPFVHAALCARRGEKWDLAIAAIAEAKAVGLKNRELIARQETKSHRQADELYDYLTKNILFDLQSEEKEGLSYFLSAARAMGLCQRDDLEFYG
ncbi:MAG: menaquinone biosynthesis protein [Nitrospinae bacterium]|nr:menaquinone biosynthesis protein [Nitrospinota bacterium]